MLKHPLALPTWIGVFKGNIFTRTLNEEEAIDELSDSR
jgi:hypothetical protein